MLARLTKSKAKKEGKKTYSRGKKKKEKQNKTINMLQKSTIQFETNLSLKTEMHIMHNSKRTQWKEEEGRNLLAKKIQITSLHLDNLLNDHLCIISFSQQIRKRSAAVNRSHIKNGEQLLSTLNMTLVSQLLWTQCSRQLAPIINDHCTARIKWKKHYSYHFFLLYSPPPYTHTHTTSLSPFPLKMWHHLPIKEVHYDTETKQQQHKPSVVKDTCNSEDAQLAVFPWFLAGQQEWQQHQQTTIMSAVLRMTQNNVKHTTDNFLRQGKNTQSSQDSLIKFININNNHFSDKRLEPEPIK